MDRDGREALRARIRPLEGAALYIVREKLHAGTEWSLDCGECEEGVYLDGPDHDPAEVEQFIADHGNCHQDAGHFDDAAPGGCDDDGDPDLGISDDWRSEIDF